MSNIVSLVEMNSLSLAIILGISLPLLVTYAGLGLSSDHPVHLFLIRAIKANRHRLFARIPGLLNPSYCSAYPLFLHWSLSFLRPKGIALVSRVLNPLVNLILVCICALISAQISPQNLQNFPNPGMCALLLALNPQYMRYSSARNVGLSSRSIGLLLVALLIAVPLILIDRHSFLQWPISIAIIYLIWGFNTFALQVTTGLGLIFLIVFRDLRIITSLAISMLIFLIIHGTYARSYVLNTFRFLKAYSASLASVFILKNRHSIWRDLVWDIWQKALGSVTEALMYAYDNSVIVLLAFNPIIIFALIPLDNSISSDPILQLTHHVTIAGMIMFFLTSFRRTRFLGEPERYIEAITPFGTIAGAYSINHFTGEVGIYLLFIYFILINCCQITFQLYSRKFAHPLRMPFHKYSVIIEKTLSRHNIRFASNNEEITKFMMINNWQFARLWSADQDYAGLDVISAFDKYPVAKADAFEQLVRVYKVNVCMIDRNFTKDFMLGEPNLSKREVIFENEKVAIYILEWSDTKNVV